MVPYRVLHKINFMNAPAMLNGKHKVEVVFMKFLNQIFTVMYFTKVTDSKPVCRYLFIKMPDWYRLHVLKFALLVDRKLSLQLISFHLFKKRWR